jgi:hypothetical protein
MNQQKRKPTFLTFVSIGFLVIILPSMLSFMQSQATSKSYAATNPCGNWITPNANGFVITKGIQTTITVRAYRCKPSDPQFGPVGIVVPLSDGSSQVICMSDSPYANMTKNGDTYSCKTDGNRGDGYYPYNPGPIQLRFYVDNLANTIAYYPDRTLTGTFSLGSNPKPTPTARPVQPTPRPTVTQAVLGTSTTATPTPIPSSIKPPAYKYPTFTGNWAGYFIRTGDFRDVKDSFTVPTAKCKDTTEASEAFWVGLGGTDDGHPLVQTGIVATCKNGAASYSGFYEDTDQSVDKGNPVFFSTSSCLIYPGDLITAEVKVTFAPFVLWIWQNWEYQVILTDPAQHCTLKNPENDKITTSHWSGPNTAEWITEQRGSSLNLPYFESVTFFDCTADGNPITAYSDINVELAETRYNIYGGGIKKSTYYAAPVIMTPSTINSSGISFRIDWNDWGVVV